MLVVNHEYIDLILLGVKLIEGRLAREKYLKLQHGEIIEFKSATTGEKLIRKVEKVEKYKTFRDMLSTLGWKRLLGKNIVTLDEAERVYLSFGDYAKLEKEYGACAIYFN